MVMGFHKLVLLAFKVFDGLIMSSHPRNFGARNGSIRWKGFCHFKIV